VKAVRQAAIGGDPLPEIAMCFALASIYLVIGTYLLRWFEDLARREATLQLT
jgi:hypothetical protein